MAIVIDGTGSITGLSAGGLPDGSITAADLAAGAARSNFGAGAVLQVVSSNQTIARFTTTSTTDVYTGFFVNITPSSSSSKILVTYYFTAYGPSSYAAPSLYRNTTKIGSASFGEAYEGYGSWGSGSFSHLDSPATTSSIDYKIYMQISGTGTTYFAASSSTGTENMVRLIAMEIAA